MDDQQLVELLQQIQDLAGVALDSLMGGAEAPAGEEDLSGQAPPQG